MYFTNSNPKKQKVPRNVSRGTSDLKLVLSAFLIRPQREA